MSAWIASGTMLPNGTKDAYLIGQIVSGGDDFWSDRYPVWMRKHFVQRGPYSWVPKAGTDDLIRRELAQHTTMMKAEGADIPDAFYSVHHFEFDRFHQATIGQFFETGELTMPSGETVPFESEGAFLAKARQLSSGFIYEDQQGFTLSQARVDALADVISQSDAPVLVAAHFKYEFQLIAKAFENVTIVTGATRPSERESIIDRWNDDQIPILVVHPKTIGHGVNLQKGSAEIVAWFSNGFSWADFQQMNARLIRSGQRKTISVVQLRSSVGVDDACLSLINRKGTNESELMRELAPKLGAFQ